VRGPPIVKAGCAAFPAIRGVKSLRQSLPYIHVQPEAATGPFATFGVLVELLQMRHSFWQKGRTGADGPALDDKHQ
jgi:hypothetical protein